MALFLVAGWTLGLTPAAGADSQEAVPTPGSAVTSPRVTREVKPKYTASAMAARIQGIVVLEAVVMPNGKVGNVEVIRSLDSVHGLDQEAIKTVKKWKFEPGKKGGKAVPVLITIEMSFTLTNPERHASPPDRNLRFDPLAPSRI